MHDQTFLDAQSHVLRRYGVAATARRVPVAVVGGNAQILESGDGPPVVILNGLGTPAAMLAPLIAELDDFTCHAVDLPGFGLTDGRAEFADDLRANAVRFLTEVLDELDIEQAVLVANSMGSLWASWLAIDAPGRVAALAHVGCPAIALDTSAPLPMRLLSVRGLGRAMLTVRPPSPKQVEELSKMVNEHPLPPKIAALLLATEQLDHFDDLFLAMLHRLLRLRGSRPDLALSHDELGRIDVPTTVVLGRDDPFGAEPVGQRIVAAMPDASLLMVDGGHAPWIHHADQIGPHLVRFLHRHTSQSAA